MTGDDFGFARKGQKPVVDRTKELLGVTTGEVRSANGTGEEGVSGQ